MAGIKDSDNVESLRKRLYERGKSPVFSDRDELKPKESKIPKQFTKITDVKNVWTKPGTEEETKPAQAPVQPPPGLPVAPAGDLSENEATGTMKKRRKTYRIKILLAAVFFFVVALVVSSGFLLFGNNNISGENIAIAVTGPFTIGGGEVLPLQVGITNSNTVPIQAATLIVDYPPGTKAANESAGDLFTERLPLETVESGETINVPIRAVVFGEENEEKTVEVSIEYRVQGSNATFFKEAEPLRFKISSSPVVVSADNLKKISSGQETDVEITITSNSPTMLPEVLVKAEYPLGFDFTSSSPSPTNGQNMWLLENFEPESSRTIKITGIVIGKETDEYAINFSVGVPNERDKKTLASVFATAQTDFLIEQPFLDLNIIVDDNPASEVPINHKSGDRVNVEVNVTNTLSETIYDSKIVVTLGGNAFSVFKVFPTNGYYDSTAKTLTWDVANTPGLEALDPGDDLEFHFALEPRDDIGRTPQLTLQGDLTARRVREDRASEVLTGTANTIVKLATIPVVQAEAGHNNGIFSDEGPIPPRVGVETTYTMSLMLQNGSNDITDAVVMTTLPQYVEWLNDTAGAGSVTYNETTRVVEWDIGALEAGAATFSSFQVSFEPRVTQVNTTPVLIGEQRVRATDQFTGTVVRDTNPSITTRLSSEAGFGSNSGVVQQ